MTTAALATAEDFEWCRLVTKTNAGNFYYSFWTLPRRRQEGLCVMYAFCRHSDDIVDMDLPLQEAAERITATRKALADAFAGKAEEPLFRALSEVVREYEVPQAACEDLLRGCEMDLTVTRYATFEELRVYCYRVASTVGLMCLPIFGCKSDAARQYAETLGMILQLTNIARDVKEDAARGRIYLPQEELRRFGVSDEEILAGKFTPAFAALMQFWRERIDGLEKQLDALWLDVNERRGLMAAEIMRAIYARLRAEMARVGDNVLAHRVRLSAGRKAGVALRVWWRHRIL